VTDVTVTLTPDEALVLFDLLHRWEGASGPEATLFPGEQVALWALSCSLESILIEPFADNYQELVDQARERLVSQHSTGGERNSQ
jgi:hypothetical protein